MKFYDLLTFNCHVYCPEKKNRNADKICVVENGQIVETGTHDELIGNENGKYLQLVRLQLRGGLDGVEG